MPAGFDILHEDADCLVVAKRPGLLTQAPLGIDSLEVRVKRYLKETSDPQPLDVYLGVPHRLDRPASGVIVFAKTVPAARKISRQFERRQVKKTYWALVQGAVVPDEATWTDHLKKIEGQPQTIVVDQADPEGRIARLHYRVLTRLSEMVGPICRMGPDELQVKPGSRPAGGTYLPDRTLLEIDLETGRTHQIRVQCASRGHPLLGDELYGSTLPFGPWHDDKRQRLIALHARGLTFRQPKTHEEISLIAPLPEMWRDAGVEG